MPTIRETSSCLYLSPPLANVGVRPCVNVALMSRSRRNRGKGDHSRPGDPLACEGNRQGLNPVPATNGTGNQVLPKRMTMAYNALDQRTQIARFQSTGTANPVATTDFTYDTANRLVRRYFALVLT